MGHPAPFTTPLAPDRFLPNPERMPASTPKRSRDIHFVGAGVSCAFGLPNTPSLIDEVITFSEHKQWLQTENLPERLTKAFKFFYPDAIHEGFRPDVVDFFSTLRTYIDVGSGFAGAFVDAPELYRQLKYAIAHMLIDRLRDADLSSQSSFLDEIVRPGSTVITSNWDLLIELYAREKGLSVKMQGGSERDFVLLKLHGSVDWCRVEDRRRGAGDYSAISERLFPTRKYRQRLPQAKSALVRVKAVEAPNEAWRLIRSRAADLFMVTMARGKSGDLGALKDIWRDAYGAISRARNLTIVGYSMPDDDIEIRTLLRAGVSRGNQDPTVIVKNPAPDVHDRLRKYLSREIISDYIPVPNA